MNDAVETAANAEVGKRALMMKSVVNADRQWAYTRECANELTHIRFELHAMRKALQGSSRRWLRSASFTPIHKPCSEAQNPQSCVVIFGQFCGDLQGYLPFVTVSLVSP